MSKKLNEKQVQNTLHLWLDQRGYDRVIPNYTPPGWWECDILALTKSGLAHEFEVKLTKSDFKKDAEKNSPYRRTFGRGVPVVGKKHEHLEAKHVAGPASFHYVTPSGLLQLDEIPAWAGLLEVVDGDYGRRISIVKKAPRLHRVKADPGILPKLCQTFYYRFWNLRHAVDEKARERLPTSVDKALVTLEARRRILERYSTRYPEAGAVRMSELEALINLMLSFYGNEDEENNWQF